MKFRYPDIAQSAPAGGDKEKIFKAFKACELFLWDGSTRVHVALHTSRSTLNSPNRNLLSVASLSQVQHLRNK